MRRWILSALVVAILGGTSQAQTMGIHYAGGQVKASPKVCARMAVEAMGTQAKILYASVTEDGHAMGWSEDTTVLVIVLPQANEAYSAALVITAGNEKDEAIHLRDTVRKRLVEGTVNDQARETICSPNPLQLESKAPSVQWKVATRPIVSTAKYFAPVASLTLEKKGFQIFSEKNKPAILGADAQRAVGLFAAPGTTALRAHFVSVAFGPDEESCDRTCDQLLSSVLTALFE